MIGDAALCLANPNCHWEADKRGCYPGPAAFRDACAKQGISVGRDFPPFEKTHARISIGTMEEMRRAVDVFRGVLKPVTTAVR